MPLGNTRPCKQCMWHMWHKRKTQLLVHAHTRTSSRHSSTCINISAIIDRFIHFYYYYNCCCCYYACLICEVTCVLVTQGLWGADYLVQVCVHQFIHQVDVTQLWGLSYSSRTRAWWRQGRRPRHCRSCGRSCVPGRWRWRRQHISQCNDVFVPQRAQQCHLTEDALGVHRTVKAV